MTIQEKIKADSILALKARDKDTLNILKVIRGEFDRISKNIDDDKAIHVIKNMKENAIELKNEQEIKVLDKYLPVAISENELNSEIAKIIKTNKYDSPRQIGLIMKELKAKYGSILDGKLASSIIKKSL
jgi:uncharacterized protein YqeY